jgi:hypothetical protein
MYDSQDSRTMQIYKWRMKMFHWWMKMWCSNHLCDFCVISLSRVSKFPWCFILSFIQSIKVQLTYWKLQVYFKFNCLIRYRKQKMKCSSVATKSCHLHSSTGIKHSYSKATAVSNSKFTPLIACLEWRLQWIPRVLKEATISSIW